MRPAAAALVLVATVLVAGCADAEKEGATTQAASAESATRDAVPMRTVETRSASRPRNRRPRLRLPPAPAIDVSEGFRAEVYARRLRRPTAMAWGPDGRLYIAEEVGRVVALDPRSRRPRVFASGFRTPLGLAWKRRTLFVSAQGRLVAVRLRGRRATAPRTVVSGLPFGLHQQDNVVVGPDGRLYLGSGSTCNACRERDRRSAAVLSVRASGRDLRVVARGLRNPFGLAFQPRTGRLYASVNGRDDLPTPASPEPAEMLVHVRPGRHYGWPGCWPSARRKRMVGSCAGVTSPIAYLEAHSSADGLAFYTGSTFPKRYRNGVFVALWGQYTSRRHGRRVDFISLRADGTSPRGGVRPFARGFEHPLAVVFDPHGALLVADWGLGTIYRIQARGQP